MRPTWMLGLLAVLALPAAGREPPAPHCVDARAIAEIHQADPFTLVLRDDNGGRHRLGLAGDCAGVLADEDARLVGRDGWICGAPGEAVQSARHACPVALVTPVDARAYAALVREAQAAPTTLGALVVRGERVRGFRGTPDYCVANRWLRSWHQGPSGIEVDVSPRQASGHRRYRIETTGACDDDGAEVLTLVSGTGTGMVCGHAGDHVLFSRAATAGGLEGEILRRISAGGETRCRVASVYPIDR
ncbi:hypothetical protein [Luteimonas deserti]|uniref:Uncharacterized protein n=1 Tax=Luteimonas deserti TaxID=2752306 RepID=A0A7Z0QQZ0_9GAMM|nr:hypothetical protein [Luteimonas deserti]NYZ61405.1 hypothetical protein [Luteimonas deserti]